MQKKPTEKQIESQILDWLNLQPEVFAFKINTTGIYDPTRKCFRTIKNPHIHKGTSDIIGLKKGRFFAIEVKAGKNVPSQEQDSFLHEVLYHGGKECVAYSLEHAMDFLGSI